jgi:DNA-binding GntR family transcriptional regulator
MTEADESIYVVLNRLLLTAALPPGTQLIETKIATIFGVSRERVRKALHRLGHEKLLDLIPNKGAFVKAPSLEGAREIYDARRVTEGGIVAHLAGSGFSSEQSIFIERHLAAEMSAAAANDRAQSIRLSGDFHLLLAQATGSELVVSYVRELISRTAMLVALYEESDSSQCGCDEHRAIYAQLKKGDLSGAVFAMTSHLSQIETRLRPRSAYKKVDPEDLLRKAWKNRNRLRKV